MANENPPHVVHAAPLQVGLAQAGADVIAENQDAIARAANDPASMDALLRRLLIDKLAPKTKRQTKKKSKTKKGKRKTRFRVETPPPSSSDESDESSESELSD